VMCTILSSASVPKQLIVKTLTGKSLHVTAGTMEELTSEIRNKEGIPEDSLRLIYKGRQLQSTDSLGEIWSFSSNYLKEVIHEKMYPVYALAEGCYLHCAR
jgi:hypothetical protein